MAREQPELLDRRSERPVPQHPARCGDGRHGLQVLSQYQNLGTIKTDGVDVNLNWRAALEDIGLASLPGRVSANIAFTRLFSFEAQEFPTAPLLENAGTLARQGLFDWRSITTLRYMMPTWNVGFEWRHLPSAKSSELRDGPDHHGSGRRRVRPVRADGRVECHRQPHGQRRRGQPVQS